MNFLTLYVTLALFAFAGNSIICRLALADNSIDPYSFTLIRIVSGAICLCFVTVRANSFTWPKLDAKHSASAFALFIYAACFSYAYIELPAGLGALILFGFVQLSMMLWSIAKKEAFSMVQWGGFFAAVTGIFWLLNPSSSGFSLFSSVLMALAGIAWAVYSILGKRTSNATRSTMINFVLATPLALLVWGMSLILNQDSSSHITMTGFGLAVISGAVTSGLGYAVWYYVLPSLKVNTAATLQLTVPVVAVLFGVTFMGEKLSFDLIMASTLVLGGVAIAVLKK